MGPFGTFLISILKIFKSLQNYWHRVTDITSFGKRLESSLIIERTIGLVLSPSTDHCTLTNKAVGTIWRALSKPQRRQGPDLRPLWLLVETHSAIRPEFAFSRAEHSLPYKDVTIYIFLLYFVYHLCFTCIDFYDLSTWGGCWFVVYIKRLIYKF